MDKTINLRLRRGITNIKKKINIKKKNKIVKRQEKTQLKWTIFFHSFCTLLPGYFPAGSGAMVSVSKCVLGQTSVYLESEPHKFQALRC